jgi:hypothetical protein
MNTKYLKYGALFLFCIVMAMLFAYQFLFEEITFITSILSLALTLFFFVMATFTLVVFICDPNKAEEFPKAQIKLE